MQTITATVKEGQIRFDNIPEGYGIHIKNYDTGLPEDTFLTQEQMEEDQVFKDEEGWFYSFYFAKFDDEIEPDDVEVQLPLPISEL